MASRAQLSQARSRARRDELLAAAIELFAEGGSRAVTHRAVATRAGLPPASTTYYFASIDELVREALSQHLTSWIEALRALTEIEFDASIDIDSATSLIEAVFTTRNPEVAGTELAIYLAAARDPQLREVAASALVALDELIVSMLGRIGIADADVLATNITSVIAGVALRRQSAAHSETEQARALAQGLRHLVAGHLVGENAVSEALATLNRD